MYIVHVGMAPSSCMQTPVVTNTDKERLATHGSCLRFVVPPVTPESNGLPMDDMRLRAMSLGLGLGIGLATGWALAQRVSCRNHASASSSTRTEAHTAAPPAQPSTPVSEPVPPPPAPQYLQAVQHRHLSPAQTRLGLYLHPRCHPGPRCRRTRRSTRPCDSSQNRTA